MKIEEAIKIHHIFRNKIIEGLKDASLFLGDEKSEEISSQAIIQILFFESIRTAVNALGSKGSIADVKRVMLETFETATK